MKLEQDEVEIINPLGIREGEFVICVNDIYMKGYEGIKEHWCCKKGKFYKITCVSPEHFTVIDELNQKHAFYHNSLTWQFKLPERRILLETKIKLKSIWED